MRLPLLMLLTLMFMLLLLLRLHVMSQTRLRWTHRLLLLPCEGIVPVLRLLMRKLLLPGRRNVSWVLFKQPSILFLKLLQLRLHILDGVIILAEIRDKVIIFEHRTQ